jgi:hypothetical protein
MADITWYAEASLSSSEHVYCAGSLAQCVRKWTRLSEAQRAITQINLGGRNESSEVVRGDQIALLARNPELAKV